MSTFYSQRHATPPEKLRYDVPANVRARVWAIIADEIGPNPSLGMFLNDLATLLRKQYGFLSGASQPEPSAAQHPAISHFAACDDAQALDFIEACFRLNRSCGGQETVQSINKALAQEGVGYELTAYRGPALARGEIIFGASTPEDHLPIAIRRDDQALHATIVKPCLDVLTHSKLQVANNEMLKAHQQLRAGEFDKAITLIGSAFESVLKTICEDKGWAYDKDRDTTSKLVSICRENGLFPSFYAPAFEAVGTIRNKLGDAHGRGPEPSYEVTREHADHMLHATSADILFLARLAGLG